MKTLIIDVREPEEYAKSHVQGAINIPPTELMSGAVALTGTPKDTAIVLYCLSGARSYAAMPYLQQRGFHNLTNGINKDQVEARIQRGEIS